MPLGSLDGDRVTRICMSHDPHARVSGQYPLKALGSFWSAICHNHLTGMLAEANPTPPP